MRNDAKDRLQGLFLNTSNREVAHSKTTGGDIKYDGESDMQIV